MTTRLLVAWLRRLGNRVDANLLDSQARVAWSQGDFATARSLELQVLALRRQSGHPVRLAHSFQALAILAGAQEEPERAARLFGAAEPYLPALYYFHAVLPIWHAEHERWVGVVRAQLGQAAIAQLWADGEVMTLDQAVAYALDGEAQ